MEGSKAPSHGLKSLLVAQPLKSKKSPLLRNMHPMEEP